MALGKLEQAVLAGVFAVSLPVAAVAQNYSLITSEREFIAKMSERAIKLLHKSGESVTYYHYDGRVSGSSGADAYAGTWTWDGTGVCFKTTVGGRTVQPGCAEISISGTTARFDWRDFSPEFFNIGN
jgi:hypothetical protein